MHHDSSIEIGAISEKGKIIPVLLAPIIAIAFYFILPETYTSASGAVVPFTHAARACGAVVLLMAIWWFTEAIPIAVTALLPIVLFPLFGITTPAEALKNYSNSTIFLFLGGFLIAAGIARWGLDKRIALLTIKLVGTKPQQIVLGMMVATGFISAWVSNTATAAMMLPIAMAVMNVVRQQSLSPEPGPKEHSFDVCVLLAVAYGASLGGVLTLIGTPPNGILVRFVEQTYNAQINFFSWLEISVPVIVVLTAATYFLLVKVLFRNMPTQIKGGREWINAELARLGKLNRGEKIVLVVFVITALLWCFGPILRGLEINGSTPLKPLTDSVIAMSAGIVLFLIPVDYKKGIHALDWQNASKAIAWDVLLLFGGGLSMAAAIQSTGAADAVGACATFLAGLPEWGVLLGVTGIATMASEVTSNTALAATLMPLLGAVAKTLNMQPEGILISATIGASLAFMMPVGTPPNAMVFATGKITIREMVRAGFWLNIIAILVVTAFCYIICPGVISSLTAPF